MLRLLGLVLLVGVLNGCGAAALVQGQSIEARMAALEVRLHDLEVRR